MTAPDLAKLFAEIASHNTVQLRTFFERSAIEGDWQLVFAASYNGCIVSLPSKGGGQVQLRIAARFKDEVPYLELRTQEVGGRRGPGEQEKKKGRA